MKSAKSVKSVQSEEWAPICVNLCNLWTELPPFTPSHSSRRYARHVHKIYSFFSSGPVKASRRMTTGINTSRARVMATKMLEVVQLMRNMAFYFGVAD